ncbi:hypothetical protein [Asticcacaulis sp. YBE204]|uniref:hypothetical protein n=1 Tax=Asticcacaulis sp. YBE204 TaxID=1282363 RepID=UPI0004236B9C|nr:hypothetical protein [Asticcacaulis sp. YBE204]
MPGTGAATGQPLQLQGAPNGMTRLNSQAGHVYRQQLSGNGPVPQQSRTYYDVLVKYFDAPPQVLGYQDDPSGRMAQVGFSATKNGAPVMAMLTVTGTGNGPATAFLFMDSPERFQSSMPAMMASVQGQ